MSLTPSSDWERVIVEWAKGSDSNWTPSKLLLSQHSGYDTLNWTDIQNTFNTADGTLQRGGDNGRTNLDHPKVYIAWSKHANYDDRNTVSSKTRETIAFDFFSDCLTHRAGTTLCLSLMTTLSEARTGGTSPSPVSTYRIPRILKQA